MRRTTSSIIAPDDGTSAMSEENMLDEARGPEPSSPEPSSAPSSTASTKTTPSPSSTDSSKRLSVYSHIEGLQDIGQLRGLRSDRRRVRFRNRKNASTARYVQALSILEPAYLQESLRLEEAQALVAAAIEDFALSVERIVARLEVLRHDALAGDADGGGAERSRERGGRAERDAHIGSEEAGARAEARSLRRRLERALSLEKEAHATVASLSSGRRRGTLDSDSDSE